MDRRTLSVVVALLAIVTTAPFVVVYFSNSGPPVPNPPPRKKPTNGVATDDAEISLEALRLLAARANVAVAQLENLQLLEADPTLLDISRQLPGEILGPRNLTICRLLGYEAGNRTRREVDEAIQMLLAVDPDSAITHWLIARAALSGMEQAPDSDQQAVELANALAALEQAAECDPDSGLYPFAIYEASRTSSNEQLLQRGIDALRVARDKLPDNLYVVSEWLLAQSRQQDPSIIETLQAFKTTLAPVVSQMRRLTGGRDPFQFIDQAISAVAEQEWRIVGRIARIVAVNALRPLDVAKSDMRQMQPHNLEFLRSRFSEKLQQRLVAAAQVESNTVRLVASNSQTLSDERLLTVRLVDFDLDGDLDLVALFDDRLDVFDLVDLSEESRLLSKRLPPGSLGVLVADLDHDRDQLVAAAGCFDADVDVVVYGAGGITVLRNVRDSETGQRSLVGAEQPAGILSDAVSHAVLVDFDHDSDLDLVAATVGGIRLYSADGNLGFDDVSEFSHLPQGDVGCFIPVDWDRDVDMDVIVTLPELGSIGYLENLRHGNFRWVLFDDSFSGLADATRLAVLDIDGNASWDICGVGRAGTTTVWTQTSPRGSVRVRHEVQSGSAPRDHVLTWDFDNNGYQDLLSWGNGVLEARRGDSEKTLGVVEELFQPAPANVVAGELGDIDSDGDLDVLVLTSDQLVLYENDGGNQNHWLQVRALGQVDNKGKVNHNGVGSLLEIATADRYQAQIVSRPVTHFGLGQHLQADSLRLLWTNGVPQAVVQPRADQAICEPMVLKGSCPYLYTWNGSRFQFVTDLLWAAPLGLQLAEGKLAPAREWEYLLVEGEQLQKNGQSYDIRITEELWEAAYFDEVALIAVDHPAEVEVFSNEKVGPAEIAAYHIHTVQRPRPPVAASDKLGRDVLDQIVDRDEEYYQGFETRYLPGSVEPHYLELDLGQLSNPERITLFLTGWIYPTDTSLNVAISQNPVAQTPNPPTIQVPDSSGSWREVVPYMGFPGGKTKTIAVDLTSAFLTDDYRLRIVTSNEIYWDQAFFTVDEPAVDLVVTPLDLASAKLRYRGFSAPLPQAARSPERYDYGDVRKAERWPPMRGRFTRHGDVQELLEETDDRLVVMSSGDEIALSFVVPKNDVPPGWKRDFLIYNVGWDKDADLNTVSGQSVEPMPFGAMKSYPYYEKEYPLTPRLQTYLNEYQTRDVDRTRFWRQLVR